MSSRKWLKDFEGGAQVLCRYTVSSKGHQSLRIWVSHRSQNQSLWNPRDHCHLLSIRILIKLGFLMEALCLLPLPVSDHHRKWTSFPHILLPAGLSPVQSMFPSMHNSDIMSFASRPLHTVPCSSLFPCGRLCTAGKMGPALLLVCSVLCVAG